MHCLHFLDRAIRAEGGVVAAVLDACEALASAGVRVTLVTGNAQDVPADWARGGAGVPRVVERPALASSPRLPKEDQSVFRRLLADADLLHLHTPWCLLNPTIASIAEEFGRPYAVTLHGMLDDWSIRHGLLKPHKKRLYLYLRGKRFLCRAAGVQCTAKAEEAQSLTHVPGMRTRVLPYIIDPSALYAVKRDRPRDPARRPVALYLGRIHMKKRPERFLRAAAEAPELDLVVAGPGNPRYVHGLQQLAERLGVAGRVRWPGMLTGDEKLRAFEEADVFVLPTYQENFGIAAVEGLAAALPVVTTRGMDLWQELEEAGAYIVSDQPGPLAAALRAAVADPEEALERGKRGRRWVQEQLGREVVLERHLAWYEAMVMETGSNRHSRDEAPATGSLLRAASRPT